MHTRSHPGASADKTFVVDAHTNTRAHTNPQSDGSLSLTLGERHSSRLAELLLLRQPELIEPQAKLSSAAHISITRHAKLS